MPITLHIQDQVAAIRLSRPEVLNSFDRAMREELVSVLVKVVEDENIRAVTLSGMGRGFCAGQDLAELLAAEKQGAPLSFDTLVEMFNSIVRLICFSSKPFVCGVNGVAAGAGANLALACDFVIASDSASFVQSFVHVGLVPDTGGSFFLPRLLGATKARELLMLGEKISAEEALKLGLIYKVVPADSLDYEVGALASRLAKMPTQALGMIKRAINLSFGNSLVEQLELEKRWQLEASQTADYKEGVAAFVEKRVAKFIGR